MDKIDAAYGSLANDISGIKIRLTEAEDAIDSISGGGASEEEITAIKQRLNTAEANITALSGQIDKISVGARNLIQNTLYFDVSNWTFDASGGEAIGTYSNATGNAIRIDNADSNTRMWLGEYPIRYGQTCTVSFKYQVLSGNLDDVNIQIIPLDISGRALAYQSSLGQDVKETCGNGWKWLSAVYTPVAKTESIRFAFRTGEDNQEYTNSFLINDFQIEFGSEVSDWNPAPEDIKAKLNAIEDEIDDLDVSTAISDAAEAKRIAGEAKTAAQSAETKAASAETKAGNAETAAANASASASSASQSASNSATNAGQAATNAAAAAQSASQSADDAAASARSASSSATSASNAAAAADTAAQNASQSAGSASAAAQSAASAATDAAAAVQTANGAAATANTAATNASSALSAVNNKDSVPTQNSGNLVSSGGVWSAITSGQPWNVTYTLAASRWSGNGPYTMTVNDGGVTDHATVSAAPANETSAKAMKAGILITPTNGTLTFSTSKLPNSDISLTLTLQYSSIAASPFFVSKKGGVGGGDYDDMTEFEIVDNVFDNIVDLPNMLIAKDGNITGVFGASFGNKTLANGASVHALTVPEEYRPFVSQSFTGRQWNSGNVEGTIPITVGKDGIVNIGNSSGSSIAFRRFQFFESWIKKQDRMVAEFYKEAGEGPSDLVFNVNQIIADTVNNKVTYRLDASYSTFNSGPSGNFTFGIRLPEGFGPLSATDVIATFRLSDGTTNTTKYFTIKRNSTYLSLYMSSTSVGFSFELTTDLYQENVATFTLSSSFSNAVITKNRIVKDTTAGTISFEFEATFDRRYFSNGGDTGIDAETGFYPASSTQFTATIEDSTTGTTSELPCTMVQHQYPYYGYVQSNQFTYLTGIKFSLTTTLGG